MDLLGIEWLGGFGLREVKHGDPKALHEASF